MFSLDAGLFANTVNACKEKLQTKRVRELLGLTDVSQTPKDVDYPPFFYEAQDIHNVRGLFLGNALFQVKF